MVYVALDKMTTIGKFGRGWRRLVGHGRSSRESVPFIGERNSPFLTEKASLALPTRILGSSKCFQVNKHSLIARK